jgi:transposase
MAAATRLEECSADQGILFVGLDLGSRRWKVASTAGMGSSVRHKEIPAGDRVAVEQEVVRAKAKFGLPATGRVVSCYEAGRDGFGPHRLLTTLGVENVVVDAASLEVTRRARRAKTDKLDAGGLVQRLVRYAQGGGGLRVVRVPSVEIEERRQLHRELGGAKADRQRARNRITSLVAAQGGRVRVTEDLLTTLPDLVLSDGRRLPAEVQARVRREWAVLEVVEQRIGELERDRHRRVLEAGPEDVAIARVKHLMRLRAVGEASAWLLQMEYFWRRFENRREVASGAGLTGTPYNTGESVREQGISKAGNPRVRTTMVELSWGWLRWQPTSELSQWFVRRFDGNKRMRRIGIVAVARRLLIALWRYLETGEIPAGAVLKPVNGPTRTVERAA